MQCASCGAIEATELQDKPIAIWTMAPLEHHIRAYIAIVGGDPSKPQSPPSEGEGESHSPTHNPHLGERTLHCLQVEIGNLTHQELHQLMEDLCQEITLHNLHTPTSNPQPTPWGEPSGSRNPNGDDQKVTFPRRGGWVPQDNHPHLQPQCDQMEGEFLRDHLLNPQILLCQIQMWGAWSTLWHQDYAWVPQE